MLLSLAVDQLIPSLRGVCVRSLFCSVVLSVLSILRKGELITLLCLLDVWWLLLFCVFLSRCHGMVCSVGL